MFTPITPLGYRGKQRQEHIWTAQSTPGTHWILAGAMLGNDILRLRVVRDTLWNDLRYALVDGVKGTLPYHSWAVIKGDEAWATGASRASGANQQQHEPVLLESFLAGFSSSDNSLRYTTPLTDNERIFGLGERTGSMNKRGQDFPVWNVDPPMHHSSATSTMYTSIPLFLGLKPGGQTYGVFIDHMGHIQIDLGKSDEQEATATVQDDSMVVYYFKGPSPADVLRQYTGLTGRMPLPPRWAIGHHQSRWGYMTADEVRTIATTYRERHLPCDSIWLDIDYMKDFCDFTWDSSRFPDPKGLADDLHSQGMHLVTIIDPGIKIDEEYAIYRQGQQRDYFCRTLNGTMFEGVVWPGVCAFPDFSRAEVRAWWGQLHRGLMDAGVDAIWDDMNEPALFVQAHDQPPSLEEQQSSVHSNTMSSDVLHQAEREDITGSDGPPVKHTYFHNAYGMQMARATREGLLQLRPTTRPFVLTRSGSAGMQRYAANWTGDNSSGWDYIALAIPMCLNISMSGVPFTGVDIGGFWNDCSGELLVRFAQLGALMPFYRNHSAKGTANQEPWAYGEPFESAYRSAIETRYRLLPYLYTLFQEASRDGSPIIRPLYYHYPLDEQAIDTETAFLVGDALLSAPIATERSTSRRVYLPAGTWFDYWDGAVYQGNAWHDMQAPLDRWPLLIRGNSILPTGPLVQYNDERPFDPLEVRCYMTESGQATFTLYEDDGTSFEYTGGISALTTFTCHVQQDRITVQIDEQFDRYRPQRNAYHILVRLGEQQFESQAKAGPGRVVVTLNRM